MRNRSDLQAGRNKPETSESSTASGGEGTAPWRRRAVMLGAAAAGAGAAASLAGRVAPASAAPIAPARPVLLGRANTETATTSVSNARGTALSAVTTSNGHSAVSGADTSTKGGAGITGTSSHGIGVAGTTSGDNRSGVKGVDTSRNGGIGVHGTSTHGGGVSGNSTNGYGVSGKSFSGVGVTGSSTTDIGVSGITSGDNQDGVIGVDASAGGGTGVLAYSMNGTSLYVNGGAMVTGSLSKGGGSFKIDHPLDPARKYLYHSFVESPDMKNIYDGTVTLDQDGRAVVSLPDWFGALNRDYRYQLTAIGAPAPDLYIAAKVSGGAFAIAGGASGQEVSWQVTGIRQDAWANANRIPVEETKPAEDQGRYLHPELHDGEPITPIARARALSYRALRQ
jgi:hypothetical protein